MLISLDAKSHNDKERLTACDVPPSNPNQALNQQNHMKLERQIQLDILIEHWFLDSVSNEVVTTMIRRRQRVVH